MRFTTLSTVLLAVLASASAKSAAAVTAAYGIDTDHAQALARNYFQFGYIDENEEFRSLVGGWLTSARVEIHFTPGKLEVSPGEFQAFDPSQLRVSMTVPAAGLDYIQIDGTELTESDGHWDTTLFIERQSAEIRSGRFSIDIGAFDTDGNPVPMAGAFTDGSGFFYTVTTPEPATLATIGGALAMIVGRRRQARAGR